MNIRKNIKQFCVLITVGVIFAPTVSFSVEDDYTFVMSFFSLDQLAIMDMNSSGTIQFREFVQTDENSSQLIVSPNGRILNTHTGSVEFFSIGPNGELSPAFSLDLGFVVFHPFMNLLYFMKIVPLDTTDRWFTYEIDYLDFAILELESLVFYDTLAQNRTPSYSKYMNGLVELDEDINTLQEAVRTQIITSNGMLTSDTQTLYFDEGQYYARALSPDGRFFVISGNEEPTGRVIKISSDGSLSEVQTLSVQENNGAEEMEFSPDGRYFYTATFATPETPLMSSFLVDQSTGWLTIYDVILKKDTNISNRPQEMAITPDGKFAILMSNVFQNNVRLDVVRLHEDGTLEWLPDKTFPYDHFPSDIQFLPPYSDLPTYWLMRGEPTPSPTQPPAPSPTP